MIPFFEFLIPFYLLKTTIHCAISVFSYLRQFMFCITSFALYEDEQMIAAPDNTALKGLATYLKEKLLYLSERTNILICKGLCRGRV